MPLDLIFTWLMVFLRALGLLMVFPALGAATLPIWLRMGMAFTLATLLYGLVPHAGLAASFDQWQLIRAAGGEVAVGLALGFVGRMLFYAVEMAGRIINTEVGLVAGPGFDTPRPADEPLAASLTLMAGVLFFLFGGHLGILRAFLRSFDFSPAGMPMFSIGIIEYLVQASAQVIELGVRIAAPFIALNFLVTLAFSILGRAVPRMQVFVLSFPVRLILGLTLLAGSGSLLSRYLWTEFDALPLRILQILPIK